MQQLEIGDLLAYVGPDDNLRGRKYRVASTYVDCINNIEYYTITEIRNDSRMGIAVRCTYSFAVYNFYKVGKKSTLMETE